MSTRTSPPGCRIWRKSSHNQAGGRGGGRGCERRWLGVGVPLHLELRIGFGRATSNVFGRGVAMDLAIGGGSSRSAKHLRARGAGEADGDGPRSPRQAAGSRWSL